MRYSIFLMLFCLFGAARTYAQDKFFTKQGIISFDATGGMEKIQAINHAGVCVLDTKTGALQLAVLLKGFEFEKALMQEHFNENYVESDKFPRAEFKGFILNNSNISYTKNGSYDIQVKGTLSLHGVSKDISSTGHLVVQDGKIQATSAFDVPFSDYHISIPGVVKDKLADHATVHIDCSLQSLKI